MKNFITKYIILKSLTLAILLLFSGIVTAQQVLCYEEGLVEVYSVDIDENGGEGSTGSTYTWSIAEPGFNGTITTTTSSGNQIEINWQDTPEGTYTLTVIEEDEHECPNSKQLTIVIDDCQCDNPPTLSIEDVNEVCELDEIHLSATILYANTILWTTSGDGTFDNDTSLNPSYSLGPNDIATGTVTISAVTEDPDDEGLCEAATDEITITINPAQTLSIPTDYEFTYCVGDTINFPELVDADGNVIVGIWSPSTINNSQSGTYQFTPDACYHPYELNITIEGYETITFDNLPTNDVCSVEDLPDVSNLPNTSSEGFVGTWAMADNGDDTYTYTFDVNDNGCYQEFNFTIAVASEVVVTFDDLPIDDVCDISELPDPIELPTESIENVIGSWTRVDNGDNSFTYTFTLDITQDCYVGTSFTVNISPSIQVSFSNLPDGDVCEITDLPNAEDLPTSSNEGITGTWIQTDNGDGTYTYTFNVDPDQGCYVGVSFTVSILANELVTFDNLPTDSVCEVSQLPSISELPTESIENISGDWSQVDNGDNTYTYVFNVDANQGCYLGTEFTVEVEGLTEVSFTNLPIEDVCELSDLPDVNDLPTSSDEGAIGTWIMTDNGDDSYTYTFEVNPDQGCYDDFSITISILEYEELEIANLPLGNVCDEADLPIVTDIPVENEDGITGEWVMIDNGNDSYTYEFIVDPGQGCYRGPSFTVLVGADVEVSFVDLPTGNICDISLLPEPNILPTTSNEGETGVWSYIDNGDNTFTFEFTLDDDQSCFSGTSFTVLLTPNEEVSFSNLPDGNVCGISELPNTSDLPTISIENITGEWTQTDEGNNVYSYDFVLDPNQGCYIGTSFSVTVEENVEVSFDNLPTDNICDETELPTISSLPTTSSEGVAGTWNQVNNGDNTFTYSFSVEAGQGCYIGTNFTVTIEDNIEVTFAGLQDDTICDLDDLPNIDNLPTTSSEGITGTWSTVDNGDDTHTFTFTINPNQGCYVGTSFTITYIENVEVTFDNLPPEILCDINDVPAASDLPTTSLEGIIGSWVRADNGDSTYTYNFILEPGQGCYLGTQFTIIVENPTQTSFENLPTADVCLISELPEVSDLPTQSLENVTGQWMVTDNGDSSFTYSFEVDPNQGCYLNFSFNVSVLGIEEVSFSNLPAYDICDNDDLPIVSDLPTTSDEGITGDWTITDNGDDSYTYYFQTDGDQGCYENTSFTVSVGENIPVSFSNLPDLEVCNISDLPILSELPTVSNEGLEGSWDGVDNGDNTYTYTFVLNGSQDCYIGTSFTVIVNETIQVSFDDLPTDNVCSATELPDESTFPTTSLEGATGNWVKIDNGDGTFTYDFILDSDEGCYNSVSFVIIVEEDIQVSFEDLPIYDVCSISELPVVSNLPTTSNESVSGVWTQNSNGDNSFTFTFTPNPGQGCYNSINFTVAVVGDVTVTFDDLPVDAVCNIEELPELESLPSTSNESVTGFWSMTNNGNNTFTYSFIIDGNQGCYNGTEFTVTVLPNLEVSFEDLPTNDVCDVAELPVLEDLPTVSLEGITGTWVLTFNGVDVYKYTFILDSGQGCYVGISFILRITENTEVSFTDLPIGNICNVADLPNVEDLPTTTMEGLDGIWTMTDNLDGSYTFSFEINANQDGCYQGTSFTIIVDNPVPVSFIDLPLEDVCNISDLPVINDLPTASSEGITGTWIQTNNSDGTYTYTFALDSAHDCYTGTSFDITILDPIATEFDYSDSFVCDVSEIPNVLNLSAQDNNGIEGIWAVSNVDNVYLFTFTPNVDCHSPYEFTLTISDDIPSEFDYVDYEICDVSDLPDIATMSTIDNNGIAGIWSNSSTGNNVYTYVFTPADNCYGVFEFNVTITASADVTFVDLPTQNVCDVNDIPQIVDLPTTSIGNVTGVWTMTDNGDNSYTYTFLPNDNCYSSFIFTVENNPPYPIEFDDYENSNICDISELPDMNTLETSDDNGVEGTWSVNTVNNVTTYTFTPNPNCYTAFAFTYTLVDSLPTEFDYEDQAVCDIAQLPDVNNLPTTDNNGVEGAWTLNNTGDNYDFIFTPNDNCFAHYSFTVSIVSQVQMDFDIPTTYCLGATEVILPTTSDNGFEGTWSPTVIATSDTGTFVYTFTPDDDCGSPYTLEVEIIDQIVPSFTITTNYCLGESADELPLISENGVEGSWNPSTIDTQNVGVTQYTFTPDADNYPCAEIQIVEIEIHNSITPEFASGLTFCKDEINPILPTVSDNGITGYWIPNIVNTAFIGTYSHTFVVEAEQCTTSYEFEIEIIDCSVDEEDLEIPHIITPNNDGYNDIWHVEGIEHFPEASIKIYNRYGKIIFEGEGAENCDWNGYFLGRPLSTSDYWYVLDLKNGNVKTGHITVKND